MNENKGIKKIKEGVFNITLSTKSHKDGTFYYSKLNSPEAYLDIYFLDSKTYLELKESRENIRREFKRYIKSKSIEQDNPELYFDEEDLTDFFYDHKPEEVHFLKLIMDEDFILVKEKTSGYTLAQDVKFCMVEKEKTIRMIIKKNTAIFDFLEKVFLNFIPAKMLDEINEERDSNSFSFTSFLSTMESRIGFPFGNRDGGKGTKKNPYLNMEIICEVNLDDMIKIKKK